MTTDDKLCALLLAQALAEVAKAMIETEAAGPCGYWNRETATRLNARATELVDQAEEKR